MQLSKNFSLNELTRTSKTHLLAANREAALNSPIVIQNLTDLAEKILQPIRDYYKKPVTITSGYRSKALNVAVGGSQASQHSYGEAADLQIDGISVDEIFADIKSGKVVNLDNVGQVIIEKVGGAEWVHISLLTPRYAQIQKDRYGATGVVFLKTTDGRSYERVV